MEISTIGLDLAKNVFQVHGISATGGFRTVFAQSNGIENVQFLGFLCRPIFNNIVISIR
jgi:hypothetical protein